MKTLTRRKWYFRKIVLKKPMQGVNSKMQDANSKALDGNGRYVKSKQGDGNKRGPGI